MNGLHKWVRFITDYDKMTQAYIVSLLKQLGPALAEKRSPIIISTIKNVMRTVAHTVGSNHFDVNFRGCCK